MKILKKQYFIAVGSDAESFSVAITPDLQSLIRNWGPASRISPVWQLRPSIKQKSLVERSLGEPVSLFFLHGAAADFLRNECPEEALSKLYYESIWLSIGSFNIIVVCRDKELDQELITIFRNSGSFYERWVVESCDGKNKFSGNTVDYHCPDGYFCQIAEPIKALASQAFSNASLVTDDALRFTQIELYALLAVMEGRARGPFSVLASDAMKVEALANYLIQPGSDDQASQRQETGLIARPDIMLTLNAGLSRLSSQALSGTTPILRTECHFWPHSLLGIGVANLALRNITAFITSIMDSTKYDQKVYALRNRHFDLAGLVVDDGDKFPDFYRINHSFAALANILESITDSEIAACKEDWGISTTPITYFSGRDGFMNGPLTTSAPLPSVSGCNSYQWNLGTITHEISHRILSGHIVDCFKKLRADMDKLQKNGGGAVDTDNYFHENPSNYGCYAAKMIGRALLNMHCLSLGGDSMKHEMDRPLDFFNEAIDEEGGRLEELLVHVFDYFHFYGADSKDYCSFVWLSWAVQPSIKEKFFDYIVRTLVALGSKHLGREDWKEIALSDFQSVLCDEPLLSRLSIRNEVLELLEDEESCIELNHYMDMAKPLIVLFHMYFKMQGVQSRASRDLYVNPMTSTLKRKGKKERRYYHYKFTACSFVNENPAIGCPRFSNPLLFLRDYSREETPSAAQSAWLLHMLAFNVDLERGDGEPQP